MNFGTPVPLLLGIFMVLGAVALFFLDRLKPGYGRDSDRVYAILFLIAGVILLGNLNMDVILSFQQMIVVGMLTALVIQNISARSPQSMPPRGRGPENDPYMGGGGYRPSRPSRPAYGTDSRANMRAELDMRGPDPYDPYARPRPMLSGRDEPRSPYPPQDRYSDRYNDGPPPAASERTSWWRYAPWRRRATPVVTCVPVAICVLGGDMRPGSGPPLPTERPLRWPSLLRGAALVQGMIGCARPSPIQNPATI